MFVIGGRTNTVGELVDLEVYDTESSEWTKFKSLQRFRHVCWSVHQTIYIHGGFEQVTPNIPINRIAAVETEILFKNHESLLRKVKNSDPKKKDGGSGKDDKFTKNFDKQKQDKEFTLST